MSPTGARQRHVNVRSRSVNEYYGDVTPFIGANTVREVECCLRSLAPKERDADRFCGRQFNRRDAPLRDFVTYGRTNKYMPVKNIKASAATAERPIQLVYLCLITATPLNMTTSVKAMDSQRCSCRTHPLQFNGTSSHRTSAKFRSQCTRAQLLRTGDYTF
jgi:hypothetical protein